MPPYGWIDSQRIPKSSHFPSVAIGSVTGNVHDHDGLVGCWVRLPVMSPVATGLTETWDMGPDSPPIKYSENMNSDTTTKQSSIEATTWILPG